MIKWIKIAGMSIVFGGMYVVLVAFIISIMIALVDSNNDGGVYYNCTWAEISPDMPLKVREECRKLTQRHTT